MGDFDESKVSRDEHGRFSGGGLGGFVAKHTGKLEGYGKGEPGAGRYEHDPNKETSPLAKWVASKHGVDLDLMRAAKSDTRASTGELKANELHNATRFMEKEIGRLTMQKEALVKEARKAEVSRVGYSNKVQSAKYRLGEKVGFEEPVRDAKERAEAQKVLDKGTEKKAADATAKRDAAHQKLGEVMKQWRSANEALGVMQNIKNESELQWRYTNEKHEGTDIDKTAKDDKSDYRFNVSHDRQGNWEITARGDTRTEGHPGEKSMVYRVDAGTAPQILSIDKKKNITFNNRREEGGAMRAMLGRELAPLHTVSMNFPPHKDTGASHPREVEKSGNARFTNSPVPSTADFFQEVDTSK